MSSAISPRRSSTTIWRLILSRNYWDQAPPIFSEIESQTRINLGENYLMTGDVQKARENLKLVYDNINNPAYWYVRTRWKPRCLLGLGDLWLQAGDTDKAESFLSELYRTPMDR